VDEARLRLRGRERPRRRVGAVGAKVGRHKLCVDAFDVAGVAQDKVCRRAAGGVELPIVDRLYALVGCRARV
jgi:hypothetical protein